MKVKNVQKIGAFVISGLLLLSVGATPLKASASESAEEASVSENQGDVGSVKGGFGGSGAGADMRRGGQPGMGNRVLGILDDLVDDGVISQDTADAITAYNDEKSEERKAKMEELESMTDEEKEAYLESKKSEEPSEKQNFLSELVEEGIVTQDEADAIETYIEENSDVQPAGGAGGHGFGMGGLSEETLAGLVEDGIISQDIADEITAYNEEKSEERKAEMEELESMTDEEKEAYRESKKSEEPSEKQGFLSGIIEEGILTQDEADAIEEYLKENVAQPAAGHDPGKGGLSEETLAGLVEDGVISQDTADAITAFITEQSEEQKAQMEEFKNMTDEEREAYRESLKDEDPPTQKGVLSYLIEQGIVTQDEADAIEEYCKALNGNSNE